MGRPLRPQLAGAIYHLTCRGNDRRDIYSDKRDRALFLALLGDACERHTWRCLSYCLMGNHYHLVVETPRPTVAHGMHLLNGEFARRRNRRHGRSGHLFGARYFDRVVRNDWQLYSTLAYVARNPVTAGYCRRPGDWPWSAHRALAGLAPAPHFLDVGHTLSFFEGDASEYATMVAATVAQPSRVPGTLEGG